MRVLPLFFEWRKPSIGAYRCLGCVQIDELFSNEALLLIGQRHVRLSFWNGFAH